MAYAQSTPARDESREADPHHDHPKEGEYIRIAIILAIITGIEVFIYYIEALEGILVPALVALSTVKFLMVVGYFMHLKFDDKRLAWIFASGMVLALAIYIGTWAMQHFHKVAHFISDMTA